ncbi:MAG: hypothetical protein JRF63_06295, partial [Deltaproteobacteria bacterium]|nr:hypothetical protein [Deltaproteobacteria bacterium]
LLHFAYDPVYNRLGVTPKYMAGIEMQQYLLSSGYTESDVAEVVVRNKARAIGNPLAPYGNNIELRDVLGSRPIATPLTEQMAARPADGAVVIVLGSSDVALETARKPVHLSGTGWCSGNSVLERRDHATSEGTAIAAQMAYSAAGIVDPDKELDVAYVSDLYAYRELMHLDALQFTDETLAKTNPDGGSLAGGDLIEANGGARFFDAVRQLRGEAGAHQIEGAKRAVVQGWRGLPTDSCAVVVLDSERRTS